ncbi:putative Ankyrin repeat domain-containing protein 50 [Mycena venus]|uniref:Putative Ankyrin repeat domain-containing protein 50 n=1 Tax=Mycena venus TaxID=2733690 RepID=A0A8H7CN54_9AGAR|nr:putative Ankyrin repeat domain-containing protein 50 [Mycena venus]
MIVRGCIIIHLRHSLSSVAAERDRIIEWYSPLNFFLRQADVFSAWQPGTGIWLLEHDLYKDWKSGRGGTLWCRGMPGAGKTVLTSLITNDLQAQVGTHNVGIAVIYLNHKETEEHSPSRLLAGIWRQLVLRKSVSSLLDRLYLDGQIFKSSRLSRHVTSSPNLHEELETTVVQRSDGMFLLAKLHIDSLTEKRTVKEIRDALNNMADDLNIAYDAIVDRINQQSQGDRKLAWRTLSWVAHAKRPLRRSEIREALAVEPGTTELDPDNLPDMDIVLSVCAGLVVINEEDDKVRLIHYTTELYLQSPHVQARAFPHAQSDLTMTCITYLSLGFEAISNDLHKPLFLFTHNPFLNYAVDYCLIHARGTPETHIRHSILSFLTNCSVWWELWNWKRGITRQSPSSRLWIAAVLRLEQTCRQIIKKGDAGFVESVQEAVFRGDTDLLRILLENGVDAQEIERECFRPLLQEAASRRNTEIVRILLDGLRPSEREYGGLALEAASTNGFDEIVALLIDHHVDIDQRFQHVDGTATALQMAAFSGHEQCVRLLIAAGAQVNSEAGRFGTALYAASYSGHQGVTRLLIEHGGDINDAVLYAASYSGHEAITRLLIEQGAKVNVNGGPALWAALVYGREQIAKLLVEHGADVAAAKGDAAMAKMLIDYGADAHHASVLCAASRRGHRRVVKTLIDHGADVNANNGRPLWEASANGHLCIVDLLIENGADINAGGGDALWIAAKNGRVDIVKMLINHGADIDAHDGLALWGASQDGHGRVVKMLIDHGADVERALQTALRYGHIRITQVLLAHGATIPEKQDLDGSFMVEAP